MDQVWNIFYMDYTWDILCSNQALNILFMDQAWNILCFDQALSILCINQTWNYLYMNQAWDIPCMNQAWIHYKFIIFESMHALSILPAWTKFGSCHQFCHIWHPCMNQLCDFLSLEMIGNPGINCDLSSFFGPHALSYCCIFTPVLWHAEKNLD